MSSTSDSSRASTVENENCFVGETADDCVQMNDEVKIAKNVSVQKDEDVKAHECGLSMRSMKKKNVDNIKLINRLQRELRESRRMNDFYRNEIDEKRMVESKMREIVVTNRSLINKVVSLNEENKSLRYALGEKRKTCIHMLCDDRGVSDLRLTNVGEYGQCWERCKHVFVRHVDRICCSKSAENV